MSFQIDIVRQEFPNLMRKIHGHPLCYLDNAATTLKPKCVVDTIDLHYRMGTASVHRGVHTMSEEATQAFDDTRITVQKFLNARSATEIIFTSGTTMALNMVAQCFAPTILGEGDEILITEMEHHANIVPWQMCCERTGAKLVVAPFDDSGKLDFDAYRRLLSPRTKIAAFVSVSNALGTINPIKEMVAAARAVGAITVIDAAQSVAHLGVDVQELDCDFLAFSGHKIFSATGTGVLYGRAALLEAMPPMLGGGAMIRSVTFEKTTYAPIPARHEAGTPHVVGVIALGTALRFVQEIGLAEIAAYEHRLLEFATDELRKVPGLDIIGNAPDKASVISFVMDGVHPHDIGTLVDQRGVAIRTGHHCAQPVMRHFGVPATSRASIALYNNEEDIAQLVRALKYTREVMA